MHMQHLCIVIYLINEIYLSICLYVFHSHLSVCILMILSLFRILFYLCCEFYSISVASLSVNVCFCPQSLIYLTIMIPFFCLTLFLFLCLSLSLLLSFLLFLPSYFFPISLTHPLTSSSIRQFIFFRIFIQWLWCISWLVCWMLGYSVYCPSGSVLPGKEVHSLYSLQLVS